MPTGLESLADGMIAFRLEGLLMFTTVAESSVGFRWVDLVVFVAVLVICVLAVAAWRSVVRTVRRGRTSL